MSTYKICSILILVLWVGNPLQGQWEIGGVIDVNVASINVQPGSSSEDYSGRLGFGIGAVLDRSLTDQIDLHTEPMFLQKGGKIKTSLFEAVYKVNYLEIPLLLRYTFDFSSTLMPYGMAGPSIGLRTSSRYDFSDGGERTQIDETRGIDLGVVFGGGVKVPQGNKTFFAEVRYLIGLINMNRESDESSVKNRGLQISLGVTVPININ